MSFLFSILFSSLARRIELWFLNIAFRKIASLKR